jgi:hypothetical protein
MWIDPLGSDPKWVRWWLADIIDQKMLPSFKKQKIKIADNAVNNGESNLKLLYDFLSNEMKLPTVSGDNDFFMVKLDDATVTWYTLKHG